MTLHGEPKSIVRVAKTNPWNVRGCSETQYLKDVDLMIRGLPSKSHLRGGNSMPPRASRIS
jgi:hypothetical protein